MPRRGPSKHSQRGEHAHSFPAFISGFFSAGAGRSTRAVRFAPPPPPPGGGQRAPSHGCTSGALRKLLHAMRGFRPWGKKKEIAGALRAGGHAPGRRCSRISAPSRGRRSLARLRQGRGQPGAAGGSASGTAASAAEPQRRRPSGGGAAAEAQRRRRSGGGAVGRCSWEAQLGGAVGSWVPQCLRLRIMPAARLAQKHTPADQIAPHRRRRRRRGGQKGLRRFLQEPAGTHRNLQEPAGACRNRFLRAVARRRPRLPRCRARKHR